MRVSELLDKDTGVLTILIEHGFTPLKNPLVRTALASNVTLGQAAGLRGLSEAQQDSLLKSLQEALCR